MTYEPVKDFKPAPIGWNVATATTNPPQCEGLSPGLGSGESEGGVARQLSRPVERRRAHDGRRSCDPGQRGGRLQRLSRRYAARNCGRCSPSPPSWRRR